jgi:hypothetical protein
MNLMMSQPGVDTDSPVVAQAVFDPPRAVIGESVTYRLTFNAISNSVELPARLPAVAGLQLTEGARSQILAPGGPKYIPQTTINFRARATAAGAYTVPSFTAQVYGKPVMVPPARVEFYPPGALPGTEPLRLLLGLPPGDLYVGQTFPAQVIAVDPGNGTLAGLSQVQVGGDGFLADQSIYQVFYGQTNRNGRLCRTISHVVTVTPIREGTNTLIAQGHAMISRVLPGGVIQPGNPFLYNPLIESDPIPVRVKALPKEHELPGFTGAIGTFSLDPPRVSTNEVRAGDPVTLSVTVRGSGNIGRLIPPRIAPLREWQAFPPSPDPAAPYAIQQRGTYSFSYTLIPLSDQLKSTPAIPFAHLDPQRGTYVNLTIPPVPLVVKPPPAGVTVATLRRTAPLPSEDDEFDTERELVLTGLTETPGRPVGSLVPLQQRAWFPALQLLPAVALGGLWAWDRRRRYLEQHPEVILKRRARRGLRRQLRRVRSAASARDAGRFVMAAVAALREVCAPHSAATPAALVCGDVLQELPVDARHGRAGEIVRQFFTAADARCFGNAAANGAELLALQPELERLLGELRARL